eukprot:SAG11_NODE_630_length_8069_cov_2.158344_8_plen_138_part_00
MEGAPLIEFGNFGGANSRSNGGDASSLRSHIDRMARDQSIVIHELVRMRKQQRQVIDVVAQLTNALLTVQNKQAETEQRMGVMQHYFTEFMNRQYGSDYGTRFPRQCASAFPCHSQPLSVVYHRIRPTRWTASHQDA